MCSIHCGVSGLLLFNATIKIYFRLATSCFKICSDMLHATVMSKTEYAVCHVRNPSMDR